MAARQFVVSPVPGFPYPLLMDRAEICGKFLESTSFDLYPYQEEALLAWFESDEGVLVTVPTGMGKTLLAEAAIFEALHSNTRLYYTSPLIALTDQKFREFQDRAESWGFSRESIGLVTGNRRINPDAPVLIVVAEILLNHLLAGDERIAGTSAVVMDEFHFFNDFERGIVWELSLVLLAEKGSGLSPRRLFDGVQGSGNREQGTESPSPLGPHPALSQGERGNVRLLLLSATVGNAVDFLGWLRIEHGRNLRLIQSKERRVPLEHVWVGDELLTERLPKMVSGDDAANRAPALVFCFNRDECWELAERLKGLPLVDAATRSRIEQLLPHEDFTEGIGPKLKQMLIRGVGVHHAGVLPKYKEVVESLFLKKLVPFVACTETLAAGVNLPARSVVLTTLIKGKRGEKKLIPSSAAHQIFGRAGRPQFDTQGYVYAFAHEDDIRIEKWRKKYEQIDPMSKDPGLMRARKDLERKKPTRRKTEQYWHEGQFRDLIKAGPGDLASRSMIPYQVLIFLLTRSGTLHEAREFLGKRFAGVNKRAEFVKQFDSMIGNLAALGYLTKAADEDHITLQDSIYTLANFRSVDPLYGAFLAELLVRADFNEKVLALESVLELPPSIERHVRPPMDMAPGPLQSEVLGPMLISMGLVVAKPTARNNDDEDLPSPLTLSQGAGRDRGGSGQKSALTPALSQGAGRDRGGSGQKSALTPALSQGERGKDFWNPQDEERPPTFPEMLKLVFDARLATPEEMFVQTKWVAGAAFAEECDFYRVVKAYNLTKQEGLILRHLLRLVILACEFAARTEDPDYQRISELATQTCQRVDPRYTNRFLAEQQAVAAAISVENR